jgi:hypothetical protein
MDDGTDPREGTRQCGSGLSCERICPVYHPGKECTLSVYEFALLLGDVGLDASPESREVFVPQFVQIVR